MESLSNKGRLENLHLFNLAKPSLRENVTAIYKYTNWVNTGEGDELFKFKHNVGMRQKKKRYKLSTNK